MSAHSRASGNPDWAPAASRGDERKCGLSSKKFAGPNTPGRRMTQSWKPPLTLTQLASGSRLQRRQAYALTTLRLDDLAADLAALVRVGVDVGVQHALLQIVGLGIG